MNFAQAALKRRKNKRNDLKQVLRENKCKSYKRNMRDEDHKYIKIKNQYLLVLRFYR